MTKSDDKIDSLSAGDTLEKAFQLLHEGKRSQSEGDNWGAAENFVKAREILLSLASDAPKGTEEEKKIAELYDEKAHEYFSQSRECLIEAMKREKEVDEKDTAAAPLCQTSDLTDDRIEARTQTFVALFSRRMDINEEENLSSKQLSIEERLQALNASLPSGFKTTDERMDSINRGLNRLGLSLYTQKEPFARFTDEVPKSEEEQVAEIMAQAKDEVAFEKNFGDRTSGATTQDDDDEEEEEEESESDDDMEDMDDDLLDGEQLVIKTIRKKVVKAQVKLAELVALLDQAKSQLQAEDDEYDGLENADDISIESTEKAEPGTHLVSAKEKLKGARKDLKKALDEWNENL